MNRFSGMMPVDEVEIEKTFVDESGLKATVQAGKNGWTVLWGDGSSNYDDIEDTAEKDAEGCVHKLEREYVGKTNEMGDPIYFLYDVFELEFADWERSLKHGIYICVKR